MKTSILTLCALISGAALCPALGTLPESLVRTISSAGWSKDEPADRTVQGTVTSRTENALTLRETTGGSVTIFLTSATEYDRNGVMASREEVMPGTTVIVHVTKQADRTLQAERVSIVEFVFETGLVAGT